MLSLEAEPPFCWQLGSALSLIMFPDNIMLYSIHLHNPTTLSDLILTLMSFSAALYATV